MKTIQTWEIMQEIQNKGEEMEGKKYKIVNSNYNGLSNIRKGEIAVIRRFVDFLALATESGGRIIALTGFEEWEEVRELVGFMEVLELIKNGEIDRKTLFTLDGKIGYERERLDNILERLTDDYYADGIAEILLEGKFYIED